MGQFPNTIMILRRTYGHVEPRRDHCVAMSHKLLEIARFKHYYEHFTFGKTSWSDRGKIVEKYITVVIAIDFVTVAIIKPEIENDSVFLNQLSFIIRVDYWIFTVSGHM